MRNPKLGGPGAAMRLIAWLAGKGATLMIAGALPLSLATLPAFAQETVCARVKIEIVQELTLERQAFDAQMKINNALDNASLTEVDISVKVTEENGVAVPITADPNDTSAKFFIRVANKQNIADVNGAGTVAPSSTAVIDWILIPAPGAGGSSPLGKKYLVGATLRYKFGAETHTLDLNPDSITVKPLPLLGLDYFLTQDVVADDPFTAAVEPPEPFTLGVRLKNSGAATAKSVKIDSAQPRIIDNAQGLLINFKINGSTVQDAPAASTLLINFGDIAASQSKVGRWIMETSLAGRFVDFTATITHADELGGAVTSILQGAKTHFLVHDVRLDLPGRDFVRDFLALDADALRLYESEGIDTVVTDQSASASFTALGAGAYRLSLPATAGPVYARIADPFAGQKSLGNVLRADAKPIPAENVWFSKAKNPATNKWDYWLNIFDVNSPGLYDIAIKEPPAPPAPPVIDFIPDFTTEENQRLSFVVQASSPNGNPLGLSASPLPAGAAFLDQGNGRGDFEWTPAVGQAGNYLITWMASDGTLSATRSANIRVELETPPVPAEPTIQSPLAGAEITELQPTLKAVASQVAKDPTQRLQFEIYADAGMTQKVAEGSVSKNPTAGASSDWPLPVELNDNTHYTWRVRAAKDGDLVSQWVNGQFFVNQFNDPPEPFNLSEPAAGIEVASATPKLALANSSDRDGDLLTYGFKLFADEALSKPVAAVTALAPGASGTTSWTIGEPLINHARYYWLAEATDSHGAITRSLIRSFVVNTGNSAPTDPVIVAPAAGAYVTTAGQATLVIADSSDADNDPIVYFFEIDTVDSFDSGNRRASGALTAANGAQTPWSVGGLIENQRYHWRVKANDGRADSGWIASQFLMNAINEAPPTPTLRNPGDHAWVATPTPTFEANPVVDPEGEAVAYRFEVYRDAQLTQRVAEGVGSAANWTVPQALADKTTYYWRLRAEDPLGAPSDWSPSSILYVSTGAYVDPSISVTAPATIIDGRSGSVELRWDGTDHNLEAGIALYYDQQGSGYQGQLIVDGLTQPAGTVPGTYRWDVSQLAPGAYYVYAVITDPRGVGRAYAAGSVVIPTALQSGRIVVLGTKQLIVDERGRPSAFSVRLGTPPTASVTLPVNSSAPDEAIVQPTRLVFTPENWNRQQIVAVVGQSDCARDRTQPFEIVLGRVSSLDPDYIGITGPTMPGLNKDRSHPKGATNNAAISLCNYRLIEQRQIGKNSWEYTYQARLTNLGPRVSGIRATAQKAVGHSIVDGSLQFGAVGNNETVLSVDTIVLRTHMKSGRPRPVISWKVEVTQ